MQQSHDRPEIPITEVGRVEERAAPVLAEALGAPLRRALQQRQQFIGGLAGFERQVRALRHCNQRRTYRARRKA